MAISCNQGAFLFWLWDVSLFRNELIYIRIVRMFPSSLAKKEKLQHECDKFLRNFCMNCNLAWLSALLKFKVNGIFSIFGSPKKLEFLSLCGWSHSLCRPPNLVDPIEKFTKFSEIISFALDFIFSQKKSEMNRFATNDGFFTVNLLLPGWREVCCSMCRREEGRADEMSPAHRIGQKFVAWKAVGL